MIKRIASLLQILALSALIVAALAAGVNAGAPLGTRGAPGVAAAP